MMSLIRLVRNYIEGYRKASVIIPRGQRPSDRIGGPIAVRCSVQSIRYVGHRPFGLFVISPMGGDTVKYGVRAVL